MQNRWRKVAIEAAGARFNGPRYDSNGANVRTSATAPRLEFPGATWLHQEPVLVAVPNGVKGPFNDARSQRQIASYLVHRSRSTDDRNEPAAAGWPEERALTFAARSVSAAYGTNADHANCRQGLLPTASFNR
jgi:hypothetical protein